MIKILSNLLPFRNTCYVRCFNFATNKVDSKSTDIINNFTNRMLEQSKEKVITHGKLSLK